MKKLLWLVLLLFCLACEKKPPVATKTTLFSNVAMTIPYKVVVGKVLDESERRQVDAMIAKAFADANQVYNNWNPHSEISQLNAMKAGETRQISAELEELLKDTQKVVAISQGRFDPTINPLQLLWKRYLEQGQEPPQELIDQLAPAIGWDKISFANGSFSKKQDATSLDLGGIAKGFLVDKLTEALIAANYPDLYVEWGGEIRTAGQHPDGRSWKVFISRLGDRNPENAIAEVELDNQAIATSGDYYQFWKLNSNVKDAVYFHIINPQTMRPLLAQPGTIASASVLASSCWFADGLATAAILFNSSEEAEAWAKKVQEQYPDVEFWFITRENLDEAD
jgi:thiamine biosynthesis lipoprotein